MRRLAFLLALAATAGFGAAPPARPDPLKAELKKMQGVWRLERVERDGRTTWDARDHGEKLLTVTGDEWAESLPGARTKMAAFDLEGKAFDVVTTYSGRTFNSEAIYKAEGDTFMVCYRRGTGNRPTSLDTSADRGAILMVYKRPKKD
jgi:uncharacterized protein (TIGR03067 family)